MDFLMAWKRISNLQEGILHEDDPVNTTPLAPLKLSLLAGNSLVLVSHGLKGCKM